MNLRTKYLNEMGVIDWKLRPSEPAIKKAGVFFIKNSKNIFGLILATPATENNSLSETKLLHAILRSIDFQMIEGDIDFQQIRFILIFGEANEKKFDDHSVSINPNIPKVVTYDLSELLINPILKAQAWQHLQILPINP